MTKTMLLGSAALAALSLAAPAAQAQTLPNPNPTTTVARAAFGAGATFPQIVYRELMDCFYNTAAGRGTSPTGAAAPTGPRALNAACIGRTAVPGTVPGAQSGGLVTSPATIMLYAPTGSGNGKAVLLSNKVTDIGTNDPTKPASPSASAPPYTSAITSLIRTAGPIRTPLPLNAIANYDGVQFIGSDDVVNSTDIANWNAAGNPAKFGNIIQIPALYGVVAIGFNGKDGNGNDLKILPPVPTGPAVGDATSGIPARSGSSGLNLTRKAVCGIFAGRITKWDNPILTAANGGVLGTGQITVVHRSDGSGTTFLLTNALVQQCRNEFGPASETDPTLVSYAFPWTDRTVPAANCSTTLLTPKGANSINWPSNATNQCGAAITAPAGAAFTGASGSSGVVNAVKASGVGAADTNKGRIGYASQDFWAPYNTAVDAPKAANLQSEWDITAGTGKFQPPTAGGAYLALVAQSPAFAGNATLRANPLSWSLQGINPNPVIPGAYPIGGFTWINMYQCYQAHPNGNAAFTALRSWLDFLYGNVAATAAVSRNIILSNGFAPIQTPVGATANPWRTEVNALLADATNGPKLSCAGKVGAY